MRDARFNRAMAGRREMASDGSRRQSIRSRTGRGAEELVAERLAALGWAILARNVRVGRSELDLLAVDPGPPAMLVVIEVRANRASTFGIPEESVPGRKLRSVYGAAFRLRVLGVLPDGLPLPRLPLRVDLVTVEMAPALGPLAGGGVLRHLRGLIG